MLSAKLSVSILREKLMQLGSVTVHCPQQHLYNMQSALAPVLQLDEDGSIWLAIDRPLDCFCDCEKRFDVVINCHKAGLPFDLDILGDAHLFDVINEIAPLSPALKNPMEAGKLLLRVKIIDIDYWESRAPVLKSIVHKLRYMFTSSVASNPQAAYPDRQMSA